MGLGVFGNLFGSSDSLDSRIREIENDIKKKEKAGQQIESKTVAILLKLHLEKSEKYIKQHTAQLDHLQEMRTTMERLLDAPDLVSLEVMKLVVKYAAQFQTFSASKEKTTIMNDLGAKVYWKILDINNRKESGKLSPADNDIFNVAIPWYFKFCDKYGLNPVLKKEDIIGKPNYSIDLGLYGLNLEEILNPRPLLKTA